MLPPRKTGTAGSHIKICYGYLFGLRGANNCLDMLVGRRVPVKNRKSS
jgi:hypothetical protein